MAVETVDAVVVGGGPNGLVAANLLADAGWQVVLLEATDRPGGAVRSAEIAAPGFRSDLASAFYPLAVVSPAISGLRLEEYGLRWTHAPAVLAHAFPDGRAAVLSRDLDATAESLETFAPGDGDRWRRLYDEWLVVADGLLPALLTPFPPVRAGARVWRRLRTGGALRLTRRFALPVRVFAEEMFAGDGAKALLTGLALHTDVSPDGVGSAAFGWLLAMLGQQYGFPVPVGGAQQLTDALVARLTARGGRVECSAPVDRILVTGGRAVGARCVDGRSWRAQRAVLADVPAPTLFGRLVEAGHLPPRLLSDLGAFRWDDATLKVDWALSAPVPWRNRAVAGAGTVHLGVGVDGFTRYAADLTTGQMPVRPFVLAGQMTTADPSRSPEGTECLWAYTHLPRRERWRDDDLRRHVERIEAALERQAPGFRDRVAGVHVATPATLAEWNPSLVGGAINGGTAAPYQQLVFRPLPGLGRADTPVDRLYLASASAHPGGGVHGACGANAARAALARDRVVAGRLYRAVVRTAFRVSLSEATRRTPAAVDGDRAGAEAPPTRG